MYNIKHHKGYRENVDLFCQVIVNKHYKQS